MILRRRVRIFQQGHRFRGDALDIDAAPAQVLQRLDDRGVAVAPVLAAAWLGIGMAARAAAAHGHQARHLEGLHGLDHPVVVHRGAGPQLIDAALGHLLQLHAQHAQFEPAAGAGGRHRVAGAGREGMALPAEFAGPAADGAVARAGLRRDLLVAQRRLLDQPARLRHRGIGVQPLAAFRPAAGNGRWAALLRRQTGETDRVAIGLDDGDPGVEEGDEGIGHAGDYMPNRGGCKGHGLWPVIPGARPARAGRAPE